MDTITESTDKVFLSLKTLTDIVNKTKIEYRIWGSIIPAAVYGKLHRPLGDIDILLDNKDLKVITNKLKQNDYSLTNKSISFFNLNFPWIEAKRNDTLPITIFYGCYNPDGSFELKLNQQFKLLVNKEIIKKTDYSMFNITFTGIPKETAYLGVYRSRFNPKRKKELNILEKQVDVNKIPKREVKFYYKNKQLLGFAIIYDIFQLARNIIGKIRITFGLPYDFW